MPAILISKLGYHSEIAALRVQQSHKNRHFFGSTQIGLIIRNGRLHLFYLL